MKVPIKMQDNYFKCSQIIIIIIIIIIMLSSSSSLL